MRQDAGMMLIGLNMIATYVVYMSEVSAVWGSGL